MTRTLDAKSVAFLNAVRYYGGEANTSEIRRVSGLTQSEANYRFRKLSEDNYIDITSGGEQQNSPKVAHLTGHGRQILERKASSETGGLVLDSNPDKQEISPQRFRDLESKIDRLCEAQKANVDLTERVEWLEEYTIDWTEEMEIYIIVLLEIAEEQGIDVTERFNAIAEENGKEHLLK